MERVVLEAMVPTQFRSDDSEQGIPSVDEARSISFNYRAEHQRVQARGNTTSQVYKYNDDT